jgi:hypothetical protein
MVTDPPYGVNYDPAWRNQAGRSINGTTQRAGGSGRNHPPIFHHCVLGLDKDSGDFGERCLDLAMKALLAKLWVLPSGNSALTSAR